MEQPAQKSAWAQLRPMSEVAYSVQASDWSGNKCRGKDRDIACLISSLKVMEGGVSLNPKGTFLPAASPPRSGGLLLPPPPLALFPGIVPPLTHCLRLNWWIKISLCSAPFLGRFVLLLASSQRRFTQEPPSLRRRGLFQTDGGSVAGGVAAVVTVNSRRNVLLVGRNWCFGGHLTIG